jgi:hypothetical protein
MKFRYTASKAADMKNMLRDYKCTSQRSTECKCKLRLRIVNGVAKFDLQGHHTEKCIDTKAIITNGEDLAEDGGVGRFAYKLMREEAKELAISRMELSGMRIFELLEKKYVSGDDLAVRIPSSKDVSYYSRQILNSYNILLTHVFSNTDHYFG